MDRVKYKALCHRAKVKNVSIPLVEVCRVDQSHNSQHKFPDHCCPNTHLLKVKKVKVKQSRYTPWRRLGGEEV
jgi:hypothetical protein